MNNNPNVLVKISNAGIHKNGKWLVKDVNLEIHRGKIVTIIGPNGSGKSTTAKIALGLFKRIEGSVERFTKKISYVPQKVLIDWTLPVRVMDFMVLTEDLEPQEINDALTLTGVDHLISRNSETYLGVNSKEYYLLELLQKNLNS